MTSRWTRVGRGTLAAWFSTFIAALCHTASGGEAPSAPALALALAFSTLACIALSGRGLALWRLALSVGLSQIAFHTLFVLIAQPIPGSTSALAGRTHPGHGAHDMLAMFVGATGTVPGTVDAAMDATTGTLVGVAMAAGHLAAAVVTIAAILWGERAARSLLASAILAFASAVSLLQTSLTIPGTSRAAEPIQRVEAPTALALLRACLRHRGPPMGRAVSAS